LHVLSDLHIEQAPFTAPEVEADVVVLAGDIANGTRGVEWAQSWTNGRPVLYVVGNHEFYGHRCPGLVDALRQRSVGSLLRVLENEQAIIGGVRFLGCTLWSDFDFAGADRREESMRLCERVVNDYRVIAFDRGDRKLNADDTRSFHLVSRRWLEESLAQRYDGPTVVITHHAPLIRSHPTSALRRALAGAFVSDLTALMGAERVDLWIFGHTHRAADLEVRGTRVISNPRGYPRERVAEFDPCCVIELGG
jgi:predicted phosphodiesterase